MFFFEEVFFSAFHVLYQLICVSFKPGTISSENKNDHVLEMSSNEIWQFSFTGIFLV